MREPKIVERYWVVTICFGDISVSDMMWDNDDCDRKRLATNNVFLSLSLANEAKAEIEAVLKKYADGQRVKMTASEYADKLQQVIREFVDGVEVVNNGKDN